MRILQGRIQDFKLGGRALKKIAPSGGRRENCWGISCEKSRFYAKKSYFSNFRGGGGGGGACAGCAPPPPLNPPLYFCPLSVHLYILPYTSRSTKFSGKKND